MSGCTPESWAALSVSADPRGYTGLEGNSIAGQTVASGQTVQLLRWAGAPTRPVRCQIIVGPAADASAAQSAALAQRDLRLRVDWYIGAAKYSAEVDAKSAFAITCTQADVYLINGAPDETRVCASLTPGAPAPSARRTVVQTITAGLKGQFPAPVMGRSVQVAIAYNGVGTSTVTFQDSNGEVLGDYTIIPGTAGPYVSMLLPNGTAQIEVNNPSAGDVRVSAVFDLGT